MVLCQPANLASFQPYSLSFGIPYGNLPHLEVVLPQEPPQHPRHQLHEEHQDGLAPKDPNDGNDVVGVLGAGAGAGAGVVDGLVVGVGAGAGGGVVVVLGPAARSRLDMASSSSWGLELSKKTPTAAPAADATQQVLRTGSIHTSNSVLSGLHVFKLRSISVSTKLAPSRASHMHMQKQGLQQQRLDRFGLQAAKCWHCLLGFWMSIVRHTDLVVQP